MIPIDLNSCILVVGLIPRKDRRIVRFVLSSVQVDSDRIRRDYLSVHYLGSKIVSGIGVLQLIVIVRLAVRIFVFRKFPVHRTYPEPVPFEIFTDLIGREQIPFAVDDIEPVFFYCIIPDTGVYNDLLSVLNFADADLLCNIRDKIIVRDDRQLCKTQPFVDCVSGVVSTEAVINIISI